MMRYTLLPEKKIGFSYCTHQSKVDLPNNNDAVKLNAAAKAIPLNTKIPASAVDDPIVTFLGTGSAIPSKYRNGKSKDIVYILLYCIVTSMEIAFNNEKSLLLDSGEGCCGQLWRIYQHSSKTMFDVAGSVFCVLISHDHADHHLGLLLLLALRSQSKASQPLLVIGPLSMSYWLSEYCSHHDSSSFTFVNCDLFVNSRDYNEMEAQTKSEAMKFLGKHFGLTELVAVPVKHCHLSFAFVLNMKSLRNTTGDKPRSWKLVYSGDCRPSQSLVDAGYDANILIHEATFDETMTEEAKAKNHCTVLEAIDVGQQMHAENIILTHFSQRYPKIPKLHDDLIANVTIAFDLMSIPFSDLSWTPKLLPAIQMLFEDDAIEK